LREQERQGVSASERTHAGDLANAFQCRGFEFFFRGGRYEIE